jgi:hypothetical protein
MGNSIPLWMQVVSAVVTWLGAITVIFAVLTFRFAGAWIQLRGAIDDDRQIRLRATNRGRAAGEVSSLGLGTRHRRVFARSSYSPLEPDITVDDFKPITLEAGTMKAWNAIWPKGEVHVEKRALSRTISKTRKVLPGSHCVRLYGIVNGKLRSGRIISEKGVFARDQARTEQPRTSL